MKKFLSALCLILISSIFLSSCSTSKKIDDKNAVPVFLEDDAVKVDDEVKDVDINLPRQIYNKAWLPNNNQEIENFSFKNDTLKVENNWENFRLSYGGRRVFAPVINNNRIYHLDVKGNLYAKTLPGLTLLWKKRLVDSTFVRDFTNGKLSFKNDKIFVSTGYNFIFGIEAKTGEILWKKRLSSIPISAPISDGSNVYVITNDNKTYALSTKDGSIVWTHSGILKPTGIIGAANPVIYGSYIISAYSSGEVYVLKKQSGEASWVHDLNANKIDNSDFVLNDVDATPIVKNDVVYAIGNGGLMSAIRVSDGAQIWQKELASIADFWLAGDFIYLVNNDNQLICLHKKTGGIKWFSDLKKYLNDKKTDSKIIYNGILMAGDRLFMTNSNHELIVASPFDGKVLQTKELNGAIFHSPIIVNGKIYLQTIDRFITSIVIVE